jgi:hypothetical protein
MASSSGTPASLPSSTARGIALAGWVLIVLFLTILSASLLPVRLLDAAWQLRVGGVLINAAPFPLIGLVLLQFAASLDPGDALLMQRRRMAAQLATLVALGYLLLAPLLATANLQRQHSQALANSGGLRRASQQLQQMRQVTSSASSIPELEQRLAVLQGPRLDAADRLLPLPVLRSRVQDLLDQASARLERARNTAPPASPWALLGDIVRTSVACLALALGFAGLARRPGRELSLLAEVQATWFRLRQRRSHARRVDRASSHKDYLRQISEDASAEDAQAGPRS